MLLRGHGRRSLPGQQKFAKLTASIQARAKLLPPTPAPVVRKIDPCEETRRTLVQPYRYASRCSRCSESMVEGSTWEVLRWERQAGSDRYVRRRELLCDPCGVKARHAGR